MLCARGGFNVEALILLVPVSLLLGALGLIGFLWALRSRQYDDLEGAAARILFDDQPGKDPPP
jgi:cbb3-type cytochrome oxidase maturation protein